MRPVPVLSLAVLTIACSTDPIAPRNMDVRPTFAVTGSVGPNVFRFQGGFAVPIFDPSADLVAFAGLPSDPNQGFDCGGNQPIQDADYQFVGLLSKAVKVLVANGNANLHVFRLSQFIGCGSVPIAQGVGRVMDTDNNAFFTGGKSDNLGFQFEGTVTLASGGTAHLVAHARYHIQPDGTFRQIFQDVKLTAQ